MQNTVSVIDSLLLVPVSGIVRFASSFAKTVIDFSTSLKAGEVPGSVQFSETEESGVYAKKITFKKATGAPDGDILRRLRHIPLIAVYTDPRGMRRVCGTPEYPFTLSYVESGGLMTITLEGKTPHADLWLD